MAHESNQGQVIIRFHLKYSGWNIFMKSMYFEVADIVKASKQFKEKKKIEIQSH